MLSNIRNMLSFGPMRAPWLALSPWLAISLALMSFCVAQRVNGQSVGLPLPRLLTTMPMGGRVGTQVELSITGENIENATALLFDYPGVTATPKLNTSGQSEPGKFLVCIDSDGAPGLVEARVVCSLGISSSRVFSIDTLPEIMQSTTNTSIASAMKIGVDSITNAVMKAKSVDFYSFEAEKGHRYIVYCSARGIESKLDPVVIVADSEGRDLLVERRGDVLDFTASQDGLHVIKIHDLTFQGGPAYFYRLNFKEIPVEAALPSFASTRTVSSFSWPPNGLPLLSTATESEPNGTSATAEKIALPCDITGNFYPAADVDVFEFAASKGEVWWVEVASERLGRPTDPSILVQHVSADSGQEVLTDVAEFSDIASPIKPSSNGYTYDGPPYDGGSTDALGRLEIKQDGTHRLQLRDLFGGTRVDPRNRYRLIVRKAAPDFALVAWGLHMELRNGDRNALSKPLALRAGATVALEVVAVRRDGFDGDIQLMLEGLPIGVTAQGLKIPAGKSRGIMLITAHQDAPTAHGDLVFTGLSNIGGQEVKRPVHMAQMSWPVPDSWGEIPSPRLVRSLTLSVSHAQVAPLSIAATEKNAIEATVGSKVTIPLVHTKRSEFSGSVLQMKAFGDGFERMPPFSISIDGSSSEAVLDLSTLKIAPGEYTLAFYGGAVAKFRSKPEAAPLDTVEIVVSEPISLRVTPAESK